MDLGNVRTYFDTRVPKLGRSYFDYRWTSSPIRRMHYLQSHDRLARHLRDRYDDIVLEVGCGPCVWTPLIAQHARRVVALDLSRSMLAGADTLPDGIALCCGDAGRLPIRDARFDALYTLRAFEYFPDKPAAIREFARVLRKGGRLTLVTKNRDYRGYVLPSASSPDAARRALHSGNMAPQEVVGMLERAGFSNIELVPVIVGRTNYRPVWAVLRWMLRLQSPSSRRRLSSLLNTATESFMVTARLNA
jgi:SAM-dependent methyltransferase